MFYEKMAPRPRPVNGPVVLPIPQRRQKVKIPKPPYKPLGIIKVEVVEER